ncbi:MAG: RNA 2',3'-cyclic phosphodiesterase [Spirochaetia bacterium]
MRCFLALPLTETMKKEISEQITELRRNYIKQIKWTSPEAMHITMIFFGDVNTEQLDTIITSVNSVSRLPGPFALEVHGIGTFPPKGAPRVFHGMVSKGYPECVDIYQSVTNVLPKSVYTPEKRRFVPHVTLGRVRKGRKIFIDERPRLSVQGQISSLVLYESKLNRAGPEYSVVREWCL